MKAIHWIIATAALAFVQPANAAQSDPEIIIYRFPGVRDDGGVANAGVATVFHCTNFSGAVETVRYVTRRADGTVVGNSSLAMSHLETLTLATHFTNAYFDGTLATGLVAQGTTAIAATSTDLVCTAMTIDASAAAPVGVALRGIRFNPAPGSQE